MAGARPKRSFDRQQHLESLTVLLQVDRAAVLENEAARNNIGTRAGYMLNDVAKATLLGAGNDVRDLLEKCRTWLTDALERGEDVKLYGLRSALCRNLALCNWLRGEGSQPEFFRQACVRLEESIAARGMAWKEVHALDMDWYLGCAAQGDYEPALARYEAHPACSREISPRKLNSPRALGYLLLQHRFRSAYTDGQVDEACERLLRSRIPLWLDHGGYLETSLWLKLAYSDRGPRLPPEQALQRAFAFLQGGEYR